MSERIVVSSQLKKPFHHRNGSDELDVFEAAKYFSGATENFSDTRKDISGEVRISGDNTQKYCMRSMRRMSLDMPNNRGTPIPLQSMLNERPMVINKEKKVKPPSSPGGKLAHFLNSLFNQTSLKSKSKKKSTKDEDDTPSSWRRKRRSSISHFMSRNTNSATATATGTATRHTPTETSNYGNPRSYSCLKPPPSQITKIPITENLNKIETFNKKSDFPEKSMISRHGFVEKVTIFNGEQEEHHRYKHVSRKDTKEFKKQFLDDDGADSDSSSDLFELTNCDLGRYSSGLPVYETTHAYG